MLDVELCSKKLVEICKNAKTLPKLSKKENEFLDSIAQNAYSNKGVWSVLITLLFYKTLFPKQDIRYHKVELENGFSGRSFDTKVITPTLRKLGLPAMAESGWLTRSLEQAHPYTLNYKGKINNKKVKEAFLGILDIVQSFADDKNGAKKANDFLISLFVKIKIELEKHKIKITPLKNREKLSIYQIIEMLDLHFQQKYKVFGASKLPVIAFYAIYQILIKELKRYEKCTLKPLGKLTASDKTSKTAGDIEILRDSEIYEAIEIKFNREIDINIIDIAYEKIIKFSTKRYSIFSTAELKKSDKNFIFSKIEKIKKEHGCQVVVNGVLPSIKYYLRLIENLSDFIDNYSTLIQSDDELKLEHKEAWNKIIESRN